jgi:integrase
MTKGRIFLRGVTYWIAYFHQGKEFRESTKSADGKLAQKILDARLKEIGASDLGLTTFTEPKAKRILVKELAEALQKTWELEGKGSPQNLSLIKRVIADFGDKRALAVTSEALDEYTENRLADDDKPATINRTLQCLARCFQLGMLRKHFSPTKVPHFTYLKEDNARQGFFDESQIAAVVSHLPEDLRDFVRFLAATGMRKGEASKLTWKMIDGDELHIAASICKNGMKRELPLVGELAEIIERRKAARAVEVNGSTQMCDLIFHRSGRHVPQFKRTWDNACEKAGCPGRLLHDLRRSSVRFMLKAGVPIQVAKRVSGHKSDAMFNRYSILTTNDVAEAMQQTEKYRREQAAKSQKVVGIR